MSRRRRRHGPPRCNECGEPFSWVWFRGRWVKFAPGTVDPRSHQGAAAYPVEAGHAWTVASLIEELQGRRGVSHEEAETEVYDMPWQAVHVCVTAAETTTDQEALTP